NGCGLYAVTRGRNDKYRVDARDIETATLRETFLAIIANDAATGGTYRRRSSLSRLRLSGDHDADEVRVDEPETQDDLSEATTQKVVAEVAYNVAKPGERSKQVIRRLEATRLYLNAVAL